MDDRYNNHFLNDGMPVEADFGPCIIWRTAKEELSMDTAHVCDDIVRHLMLGYWRQQWLLRGG
eukprot:CAMPEP_0185754258 /NCGR_PEP_ID=MMETSP1174-20130828/12902_1 /TAXON_ID=35687 /ORGANISM="Dictyocha speculum, Strain CCMP1381" /LENGTH=62 /DNA_ID=CAMNT_0028432391 /DNA_START=306 /DNA_END=490 /DNA_ORIENTATION=-